MADTPTGAVQDGGRPPRHTPWDKQLLTGVAGEPQARLSVMTPPYTGWHGSPTPPMTQTRRAGR